MSYTVAAREESAVQSIPDDRTRRAVIAQRDLMQRHFSEFASN